MKLFKKLVSIYSGSYKEGPMRKYIKQWVFNCVKGATVEEDKTGNIYITKGIAQTYPCVVAHLDQVQKPYPKDYKVVETDDIIFGYSPAKRAQCGLGADDKCGIWIALKMLKSHDVIKVAFFPGEEVGCVGSRAANMKFFDDVRFVVEPDRRGASDLITTIGEMDICSEEFVQASEYKIFGYIPTNGLMTDVETLKERGLNVSCINLSCGYYSPHTENEYVVKADMLNALNFVNHIIENCTDAYYHETSVKPFDYFEHDDWYRTYFNYGAKNNDVQDYSDAEFEEYYNQLGTAEEYIAIALLDDPNLTASSFLASYGATLDMLAPEDIDDIIEQYRPYDDGEMRELADN